MASYVKHCTHGHDYSEENTRWYMWKGKIIRYCKQCRKDYDSKRKGNPEAQLYRRICYALRKEKANGQAAYKAKR